MAQRTTFWHGVRATAGLLLLPSLGGADPARASDPLGAAPGYTERALTPNPAAPAVTRRIWSPGLGDGFVPQGLTFAENALFLGAYRSTEPSQGRGSCRVFRIDPATGAVTGSLDLPPPCGHAGGLARGGPGRIWVADTRHLLEIEIDRPAHAGIGRAIRTVELSGDVRGSFAASTPGALWVGRYSKDGAPRLWRVDATASLPLPLEAQGAAFDAAGMLWITRSGSRLGELLKADPRTGAIIARHAMPAGIEDISFSPDGGLWAVSEAGSRRWLAWPTFYPLIFRLDPARLQ